MKYSFFNTQCHSNGERLAYLLILSLSFCLTEVGVGGKSVIPISILCFCLHYHASRGCHVLPHHFPVSCQKQFFPRTATLILVLHTLKTLRFYSPVASTLILQVSDLFSVFSHSGQTFFLEISSVFHHYQATPSPARTVLSSFPCSLCLITLQQELQSWLCRLVISPFTNKLNLQSTLQTPSCAVGRGYKWFYLLLLLIL